MTEWRINDTTALGVVGQAGTDVADYTTKLNTLDQSIKDVNAVLTNSGVVSSGMTLLGTRAVTPGGDAVRNRSSAAVSGTRTAIGFYQHAQYVMASLAQRRAAGVATPAQMPGKGAAHALRPRRQEMPSE